MKFQIKFELPETPDYMRLYIATEKNKSDLKYEDYEKINRIFSNVKSFDGIFFTTEYDDLPDENNNLTIIYSFRIVNKSLLKFFHKYKNKLFEQSQIMRNEMSIPYQYWSVSSLKDELKRRNIDPKEYKNITDKDELVSLIEKLDKKKRKVQTEKKTKAQKKRQAKKEQIKNDINESESLISLTLSKLKSIAKDKGFPISMIKGKKKVELIDMISHADDVEKKVEKNIKDKKPKKISKKKSVGEKKTKSKRKQSTKKKTNKPRTGESFLDKKIRLANEAGDDLKVERLLRKKARKEAREKNVDPEIKELIKEFNKKYRGKKVNWNDKLKKAGIWETGMQFITNYEKSLFLEAKSQPRKLKKMLDEFRAKRDEVNKAISGSMKNRHQSKKESTKNKSKIKRKKNK